MASNVPPIRVEGLAELRRDMVRLDKEAAKALRGAIVSSTTLLADESRVITPYGIKRPGSKITGHLRDQTVGTARGAVGIVRNPLPYANVQHWGGDLPSQRSTSMRPHGRTHIVATLFLSRTADEHSDEYLAVLGSNIDRALTATGWR